jgi:hypothetical protein
VDGGATVTIARLTVANGMASSGGGISSYGALSVIGCTIRGNTALGLDGGGIFSDAGTLTVTDSLVTGNSAPTGGAGIFSGGTSGVISGCTISDNTLAVNGAGIYNSFACTLQISNSTISGNSARNVGGGIANFGSTVTLLDSTVSGNSAPSIGGGVFVATYGGNTVLGSSIVAGNTCLGSPDIGGPVTSRGHNLIGDGSGSSGLTAPGDLVGTSAAPIDPRLGPLQDHGGPTPTMAPLAGSPAIDAGDPAQLGVADQRGVLRGGGVNVGAFQASASAFALAAPNSARAGAPLALVVTATDPFGQAAVGYRGTVHLSSSDPRAVLPANYTFTAAANGVHTFPVTLKTAGSQSISATDSATGGSTAGATRITITPAAASQLVMTAPAGATAGVAFSLTVTARDAYGNVATDFSGRVGLSIARGPGDFARGSVLTATAHNGSAAFGNLILNTPGSYRLKAVSGALAAAASGPLIVAQDVSNLVRVAGGAMIRTGRTQYQQAVAITNASGRPLSGPLALLVSNLSRGAVLSDASGSFLGHPYLDFLAAGQRLQAGQRVVVTLTFRSAAAPSPGYAAQVLRGI